MQPKQLTCDCQTLSVGHAIDMADSSVKAAKIARVLAILHIIVGFLIICFDTADRFFVGSFWTTYGYFGIWIGVWVSVSGL